jgi:methylglutaconyl-CoA hydratase
VASIVLDRPEKRNALDALTIEELKHAVRSCDADAGTRVLLLRGAGPDFCAGADLDQLEQIAAGKGPAENLNDAMALGELFIAMRRAAKPIVAAVHGHALAGGAGLATAADLIVASEDAVFGYPEVRIGFVPAMVTVLLRRSIGEKAVFEAIALGDRFDARQAERIGLVARVFPDDRFEAEALAFAHELASRSSSAIQLCKRLLYGTEYISFEDAIARAAEINVLARATPDCREGVRRFLERRR